MKESVAVAIKEIEDAGVGTGVRTKEDADGGACVIVDGIAIGDAFSPSTSWIGFHIVWTCPDADVYPHFIDPGLTYIGSAPTPNQHPEGNLPAAISRGATMPGFENPGDPDLAEVQPPQRRDRLRVAEAAADHRVPEEPLMQPWMLRIEDPLYERLHAHLFPGDEDEHGAVIAAGIVSTERGTRLLARDLFLAEDGVDFVPGVRGYRRLTAEFVRERIRFCRDERLVYLAVHNHGGTGSVAFSDPDMRSHERGYPALLDISGQAVGALVLARTRWPVTSGRPIASGGRSARPWWSGATCAGCTRNRRRRLRASTRRMTASSGGSASEGGIGSPR